MSWTKLELDEFQFFVDNLEERTYKSSEDLFYEGHIPTAGYIFIDGKLKFGKRNKIHKEIDPCSIFGVKELLLDTPASYFARVYPGSSMYIIDRSSLIELRDHHVTSKIANKVLNKILEA